MTDFIRCAVCDNLVTDDDDAKLWTNGTVIHKECEPPTTLENFIG